MGKESLCSNCKQPKRTNQQNRAIHLFFTHLATALNDAGYDMRSTIRQEVDIPWTAMTVKEYLWRPIQEKFLLEQSTTRLKKKDVSKVYDVLNKIIGERTGVYVAFPSIEELFLTKDNV